MLYVASAGEYDLRTRKPVWNLSAGLPMDTDQTEDRPLFHAETLEPVSRGILSPFVEKVRPSIEVDRAARLTARQIGDPIWSQAGFKFDIGISLASLRRFGRLLRGGTRRERRSVLVAVDGRG